MCKRLTAVLSLTCLLGTGLIGLAIAQEPPKSTVEDSESVVAESDVPPVVLASLKKLAGSAHIREFARETEFGHTFYEGSWAGTTGNVDAILTDAGDLMAIEEGVPESTAPRAARTILEKVAGADAKVTMEKKTMILYEAHWTKDGKEYELVLTPDGRPYVEATSGGEAVKVHGKDKDKDQEKEDDDD